ncbi:MAG: iron-sulfur cluster assembly accessory protein [Nitrososphaerota archaeon]|jgi:iron-sulfur cluster assembly accessory protein|nr:iron-sulfur cluster assembly accessory protein [Nitrososphaerota archaeon]MDG6912733.1 iron-sulfur cluster assembly accessory protein [Nitrososphaerota archaeon]MDG6952516.1 iron-sulfur cluster assembly accessory protein [Nitrososphaerota archaeon]MDG6955615.1 iron-sulfur cluster assembly accessory protein [Nitrososphaerota archaeon]MDG6958622.1 iron-sulfur cluster assembly accessory protein [Nitrososphaerota archaeon]
MQELQPLVVFTPEAREKIGQVLEQEKATDSYLKIEVYQGGGCACSGGYRYALSLEKLPGEADVVEEVGGLRVMAAKADAEVLRGSKIDFVESLQRTGFKIDNPNVRSDSCGCGAH